MLRFSMDMRCLCRNRNFLPLDTGVSSDRYKCFSRATLMPVVRNINVYRERCQCPLRKTPVFGRRDARKRHFQRYSLLVYL